MFKVMDKNGNGTLDPVEFKYAMQDYGVSLTEQEISAIIKNFDSNRDGKLSFTELLRALQGDLSARRTAVIDAAYAKLDKDGSGLVTLEDVKAVYDASYHPEVAAGHMSAEQALLNFMGVWETHKKDGIVTREEFSDYYKDLSAGIESDEYFEEMVRKAWKLDEQSAVKKSVGFSM